MGLHSLKKAGLKADSTILISGMGPIGLLAVIAASYLGASKIITADIEPFRLKIAKKLGATHTINVLETEVKKEVVKLTNGKGVDVLLEASGNKNSILVAMDLVAKGGDISAIGFGNDDIVQINYYKLIQKEISIHGIYRFVDTYDEAIKILTLYNTDILLTDFYSIDKVKEAFDYTLKIKIKVLR